MGIRVVYTDLDGTMVGPSGCFFQNEDHSTTLDPAHALIGLHRAGIALVLVSGRTRPQLVEASAIFGADGFIAELGAIVGWDHGRGSRILRGAMPDDLDRIPDPLLTALIERYPGRLEAYRPWHPGREVDVMLRGNIEVAEVNAWLVAEGFDWLTIRDNGIISRAVMPTLDDVPHIYHLVPEGVSKGAAVAFDLARRGLRPEQAIAIGDSASDLVMAGQVGRMHLVANALRHSDLVALLPGYDNVVVEDGGFGSGWASAVRSALPTARPATI
ncbi:MULTISPECIES: HAD hydrolase family protein [unclassified Frankia]|uniref:HAD hydrolase family protein n=1 Tax=unclassified Frankia TaxID=2632575 RepID=UPI001EF43121|nr:MULTISPECIES: HAD hydrolase family protein [unclassified Frankia]